MFRRFSIKFAGGDTREVLINTQHIVTVYQEKGMSEQESHTIIVLDNGIEYRFLAETMQGWTGQFKTGN